MDQFDLEEDRDSSEVEEFIDSLEQSPAAEEDEEDFDLSDVELRLSVADYYRAILNQQFFQQKTEAAKVVNRQVRNFIREQLEILLGLRDGVVGQSSPVFTDRQTEVLKLLGDLENDQIDALMSVLAKLTKKPSLVDVKPPPVRTQPELRQTKAPVTKPKKAKATQSKQSPKAAPVSVKQPAPTPKAPQDGPVLIGPDEEWVEGAIMVDGVKRFKIERNAFGTLFKRDVSGQQVPSNYQPTSQKMQEIISAGTASTQTENLRPAEAAGSLFNR